jgi:hypothetical protein
MYGSVMGDKISFLTEFNIRSLPEKIKLFFQKRLKSHKQSNRSQIKATLYNSVFHAFPEKTGFPLDFPKETMYI